CVEIERFRPEAEKLVFVRDPESKNWRMTEPHPIRVDRAAIDHLVDQVRDARKYENVDLTSNLAEWELDSPAATITLKKGDRAWKLNLGKERTGKSTGVVYVTSSDNPKQPQAVLRSQLESVFNKLADFRARDLLTESNLNITYVNLQEPKRDPVILAKTDDGRWRYEKPAYGDADYEGDSPALGA